MNYFVSFDLSVPPRHWQGPRRQRAATSKSFWDWAALFLDSLLKLFGVPNDKGQDSPACVLWHPMSGWAHIQNKWALIYSGSVAPLLYSCFISAEVLQIWFQLQLKRNVAAAEKTGEIVGTCSSVPIPLNSALLCLPLLVAGREKKKIRHPKNMKYHVSAGWDWGSWVLSVWKEKPDEIAALDFLDRGLCNWMVHLFSQYVLKIK